MCTCEGRIHETDRSLRWALGERFSRALCNIVVDNGPESAGKALDLWAYKNGVHLHFIRPGKPVENPHVESFNGKFRDECLDEN